MRRDKTWQETTLQTSTFVNVTKLIIKFNVDFVGCCIPLRQNLRWPSDVKRQMQHTVCPQCEYSPTCAISKKKQKNLGKLVMDELGQVGVEIL